MNHQLFFDLDTAAIGRPITRAGVSFFPVYLMGNELPPIATGPKAPRLIEELESASVPDLVVSNPGKLPLLLIEGEQFLGGLQNRTINVNVLVPPGKSVKIPVSCLEQGRWGRRQSFGSAPTRIPPRVRRVLHDAVAAQAGTGRARAGAQSAVWSAVEESLRMNRVVSETAAIADADEVFRRERHRGDAVRDLERLGPLPGQCGFVVTHGRRVVGTELFGSPDLLRPHWPSAVRSYLLEQPEGGGFPSPGMVLRALHRIGHSPAKTTPGLGLGEERHYAARKGTGQALTLDGALVAASSLSR